MLFLMGVTYGRKGLNESRAEQKREREGEKDTDERRESSGRAPRLGARLKKVKGGRLERPLKPWALSITWRTAAGR